MKKMTFRQLLQEIHLWLALILFIPLVILGLTGSALVYHDDIPVWFGSDEPRYELATGTPAPIVDLIAATVPTMGDKVKPAAVMLPSEPGQPATVRFARANPGGGAPAGPSGNAMGGMGGGGSVKIDPVSLAILDVQKNMQRPGGGGGGFFGVMHQLHGSLMIPEVGRDIVGWLGVVMLFLGISGLVIWWPRPGQWRQQLTIKKNATTLRLNRDLHNTFGFWGMAVFVIVSFTGLYIVYPQPINWVVGLATPVRDLRPNAVTVQPMPGATPIDVTAARVLADAAVAPDLALQSLFLPQRPDQPYRLSYTRPGQATPMLNATVFVDPWAGKVIDVRDPASFNAGDTFAVYQRPLHYGFGWGEIWKFLVFLSGLLPLLFSVTGLTMWWMKRQRRKRGEAERLLARQMAEARMAETRVAE
nr:PepSY-associated TM helix domain-containing protein [uncultured Dongia sp.]